MADLTPFDSERAKLMKAITEGKGLVPIPFGREILLIETYVAGTFHLEQPPPDMVSELLKSGEPLSLIREPENEFDEFAIRVETASGIKCGYVPKKHNEILARLMDEGKKLYATLDEHSFIYDRLSIDMSIYMSD